VANDYIAINFNRAENDYAEVDRQRESHLFPRHRPLPGIENTSASVNRSVDDPALGGRYEIPLAHRLTLSYPTCCLLWTRASPFGFKLVC
jgi:hypothetical protein